MSKREDYISWDEYFMGVALLAAKRSKDPNTQVGACIVNENKKIINHKFNIRFKFEYGFCRLDSSSYGIASKIESFYKLYFPRRSNMES